VGVWRPGTVENALSVDGAEVGKSVAQGPAFLEGGLECFHLAVPAQCRPRKVVGIFIFIVVCVDFVAFRNH